MTKHPLSALIFDYTIYPRGNVDSQHVTEIAHALQAGASLPPIVIHSKSKRVIDGFHRGTALRRLFGEEHEVECVEKTYKDEAAMFIDAMRYNASHGRALSQHDKARCLLIASKLSIDTATVGAALNLTAERIGQITAEKMGTAQGRPIALKNTIRHMAGQLLTPQQIAANDRLGGMNQSYFVNQVILLLENDLIDSKNEELQFRLQKLFELLAEFVKTEIA